MQKPAPLILLVGMHRSGTSLLGSLLPCLGVELPGELIPGDFHNPEGYYERQDVTELQENLLIELDRFWAGSRGFKSFPRKWRSLPATRHFEDDLRRILLRERNLRQRPWAIKDPRTSLFLPIWRDLCFEQGIPLQLVLALREPKAVIASVMSRDEPLAGMTFWRAQQLWWRFNTAVLSSAPYCGETDLVVVNYENWFDEPELNSLTLANGLGLDKPNDYQLQRINEDESPFTFSWLWHET